MNRNIWKRTFVASIGFNCVLALVLFTYEVLDMWGWNPLWILPMTVLVLGCGFMLIRGWVLEHQGPRGDQAIMQFTLVQDGLPLAHLVFTLAPVDEWGIADCHGGNIDGYHRLEQEDSNEEGTPLCPDPVSHH